MTVLTHPWKDLTPGPYLYWRPDWSEQQEVDVIPGEGRFAGQLMVRQRPGLAPSPLSDVPADARFEPTERTAVIADGVIEAWRQPAVEGLRSEDVGPFVQALARRPNGTTNVMPALEGLLMAVNGMDVTISVTVRPKSA